MIPFRNVALILAVVFMLLFIVFVVLPGNYLAVYGVPANAASEFTARRAAPVFLGLAVMIYLIRDAGPGPVRDAVCTGLAIVFAGIAFMGLFEYGRGYASFNIVVAACAEMTAAAVLLLARRRG